MTDTAWNSEPAWADFLLQPPDPQRPAGDHGEITPEQEWMLSFAWVASVHIFVAVVLHYGSACFPVPLRSEIHPNGAAVALAAGFAVFMSGLWLRKMGPRFSASQSSSAAPAYNWSRVALALAVVLSTSVMLLAAEASLVSVMSGDWRPNIWRVAACVIGLVLAFFARKSFNPFQYRAKVVPQHDSQRCAALLMFVSRLDGARVDLATLLHKTEQLLDATELLPAGERLAQVLELLGRYPLQNGMEPAALQRHEFIQNLRGIRAHRATLRSVHLLPSQQTGKEAADLKTVIERWDRIYRRLHPQLGATPPLEILIEGEVDYESFEKVEELLRDVSSNLSKRKQVPESEIIIDITSGKKPNSASALIYTLGRQVRAQYVDHSGAGVARVRLYDVHPVAQVNG